MKHPLEFFPENLRKLFFVILFILTIVLYAISGALDQPLEQGSLWNGILGFEFARTPENAKLFLIHWASEDRLLYAAFGLGFDYLFLVVYGLALAFGTLLAAQKHTGWIKTLAVLAGYGAFGAALFDAIENHALFQVLLGNYESGYPAMAAFCATVKFSLLIFGLVVCVIGWLSPKKAG